MEAPDRNDASLPALAAIGILTLIVLFSISLYLLLGTR
jgi:hypothetical protein